MTKWVDYLQMVIQNETIPLIGDATGIRGSTTPGSLYFSLHKASPGEGGNQTTNEIDYTGYNRASTVRNDVTWGSSGLDYNPNFLSVEFSEMTGGTGGTATYIGIGTEISGAGVLLYYGLLDPAVVVQVGVTPSFNYSQCHIVES